MAFRPQWRFWAWPSELHRDGILGLNRRNGRFILPNNPRRFYPSVDEKHRTKEICHARGIPVPETYAIIERSGDVVRFLDLIGDRTDFVIKPAAGSAGRGITVIVSHDGSKFVTSSGERLGFNDLTYHLSAILSGLYSLGGQVDRAIIEQRIVKHPVFEKIAVDGTPDIRVILYRCVPIMAMVRLPTHASRGKANLHQGAAAAGIHLVTGRTTGGVYLDRPISKHPDTGNAIAGIKVPFWDELLAAAMNLGDALELGYIGIDFVLDAVQGPVVLEANARPGLNIQVANRRGLLPRLDFVRHLLRDEVKPECRRDLIAHLAKL